MTLRSAIAALLVPIPFIGPRIEYLINLRRQNAALVAQLRESERALSQTRAELEVARSELEVARSELEVARSELEVARSELEIARRSELALSQARSELEIARQQISAIEVSIRSTLLENHVSAALSVANEMINPIAARLESGLSRLDGRISLLSYNVLGAGEIQREEISALKRGMTGEAVCHSVVDRYLDLLESSLTGTLTGDRSMAPWTPREFDPSLRAIGRDRPETACTMIGAARMRNLRRLVLQALDEQIEGDLLEAGVWRGGACIYMKGMLEARRDLKRRVFVADSFQGLPPPNPDAYPADAGDEHSKVAELAVSVEKVVENFRRYGLLDDRVCFLEGWFKDTLKAAPIEKLAILRLDGDMYESTMDTLNALYHKVSAGGFVIIDDYILDACAQATNDFRARHGITASLQEVDGASVWWRVPRATTPGQR